MVDYCLAATVGAIAFASFDVWWFLRLAYTRIANRFKKKAEVQSETSIYSICWTTDIDYFCHMNNGKYFREMDFGRFDFYFRTGLSQIFANIPKTYIVQHAAMIRYRRSLDFLMPYKVVTRLVWFDERSLYFEQRFVSLRDNFVRAIAICKNTAVNCDVTKVFEAEFGLRQPKCPDEVAKFIEANDLSSNKLRMAGQGASVASNLSDMKLK